MLFWQTGGKLKLKSQSEFSLLRESFAAYSLRMVNRLKNPRECFFCVVFLTLLCACGKNTTPQTGTSPAPAITGAPVIAMLPKLINIDYFDACKRGAEKTAKEIGVTLIYDGPTEPSGS